MTTPNDDQNLQEQPNGSEGTTDADDENSGWTNPASDPVEEEVQPSAKPEDGSEGGEQGDANAAADEPKEEPKDEPKKADAPSEREKAILDKYSMSKNEAETLRKAALKLEQEGLLDRAEIAEAIGVKKDFLDSVLDKKELPEVGEDGHVQVLQQRFVSDFNNPSLAKAAERLYGPKEQRDEILQAFDYAVQTDAAVRDQYLNATPDDVFYLVMDAGKAALDTFREAQKLGGPAGMMAEITRLRAENAELKSKPAQVTTQAKTEASDEDEQETEQPAAPAPKNAREAHVRAMMN